MLVDRVIELELQQYAVGYKNVTANDNFFTGHFPERKIMPGAVVMERCCRKQRRNSQPLTTMYTTGVLQVEALAQLGGIVMMNPERDPSEQQNFFFGGIEACKFRRPVVPGDVLVRYVHTRAGKLSTPFAPTWRLTCALLQMMRVELTKFNKRYGIAKLSAKAYVGAELCCEADSTLVLAK